MGSKDNYEDKSWIYVRASHEIVIWFTHPANQLCNRGGLETLFGDKREYQIQFDETREDGSSLTIADLLQYLKNNYMDASREELFLQDGLV